MDHYKASYQPCQPSSQPKMFNSESRQEGGHFDQLQREFLDSAQSKFSHIYFVVRKHMRGGGVKKRSKLICVSDTAESQQLAQMEILNKAQLRQMEDLEQKLEDSRRNMRYLEHQFAIVKGMLRKRCIFSHT